MRQAEQRLWDSLKRNLPKDVWAQRIENVVSSGMPDVLLTTLTGGSHWFELKCFIMPARAATPCFKKGTMRQEQINWHLQAALHDVRSWLLVRDDNGWLYLVDGSMVEEVGWWTMAEWQHQSTTWEKIMKVLT